MECYVFVDDSNLWIAGQKAQGKKLKDADIDSRYRVDLGKFLQLLTKDRHLSQANLYGSVPPPNDTLWKAAREKNYVVKTFERSASDKEKELDVAMGIDITKTLYTLDHKENVVFVVVTGDRDLKPPIIDALANGVPVELWSWEDAMARQYRKLANTHELFSANCLDKVSDDFGYTAIKSPHKIQGVDPGHAIVYRKVPSGNRFLNTLAGHLYRLMRLFYISSVGKGDEINLIVQFPNTKAEVVLKKLPALGEFEYQPISYAEYMTCYHQEQETFTLELTNRFEALTDIDTDDFESVVEAIESSMSMKIEDISKQGVSTEENYSPEEEGTCDDDWEMELRRKLGRTTRNKRRKETKCKWGDHCAMAFDCPYEHTEYEVKLFTKLPKVRFKFFKTLECNKKEQHTTAEQRRWCAFAHDAKDSWCIGCQMYGHLKDNCLVN